MATKPVQMNNGQSKLDGLRDQLKRIQSGFGERILKDIRRERVLNQGACYTAWDFPEAVYHDLKAKMK